jgi:hypothetical protein
VGQTDSCRALLASTTGAREQHGELIERGLARLAGGVRVDAGGGVVGRHATPPRGHHRRRSKHRRARRELPGRRHRIPHSSAPEAAAIRRANLEAIGNGHHHSLSPPRCPGGYSNPGSRPRCNPAERSGGCGRARAASANPKRRDLLAAGRRVRALAVWSMVRQPKLYTTPLLRRDLRKRGWRQARRLRSRGGLGLGYRDAGNRARAAVLAHTRAGVVASTRATSPVLLRKKVLRAAITRGSNWVPAQRWSSAAASASDIAGR